MDSPTSLRDERYPQVRNRNKYGATLLMAASQGGHAEIVKLLLAAKADVNANAMTPAGKVYTPLRVAKEKGHTEVVRLLTAAGAK